MDNGRGVPPQVSQRQARELPAVEHLRRRAVLGLRRWNRCPREEPAPPTGGACGRPGWHDGSGERPGRNVGKHIIRSMIYPRSVAVVFVPGNIFDIVSRDIQGSPSGCGLPYLIYRRRRKLKMDPQVTHIHTWYLFSEHIRL